jgi:hypothetical protein
MHCKTEYNQGVNPDEEQAMKNNIFTAPVMLLLALFSFSASVYLPSPAMQIIALFRNMPMEFVATSVSNNRNSGYAPLDYLLERIDGIQTAGQPATPSATGIETRLSLQIGKTKIEFEVDGYGIVTGLVLHQTADVMSVPKE